MMCSMGLTPKCFFSGTGMKLMDTQNTFAGFRNSSTLQNGVQKRAMMRWDQCMVINDIRGRALSGLTILV